MSFAPIPFTDRILRLPETVPFVGPETQERRRGRPFRARLGANESVFGPAPEAVEAMARAAAECWRYGDPEAWELRRALAGRRGTTPDRIVLGEGVDGLLGTALRLFVEPGAAVVTLLGAYPTFAYHVAGLGGRLVAVPYRDDRADLAALAEAAQAERAVAVYLANPDNPMGSWRSGVEIAAFLERLPEGCVLFLDQAYLETAPAEAAPELDPDDPRVIRFRTFSKAYGLAGLRVGYALAHPAIARAFDKVRNHFGVGRVAQAGALAALEAEHWVEDVVWRIAEGRERLGKIAEAEGLRALPSATNFVTIDCGRDGEFARRVLSEMIERDVFVRMPGVAPLDRCIRVTVGTEADLACVSEALPEALSAARAAPASGGA